MRKIYIAGFLGMFCLLSSYALGGDEKTSSPGGDSQKGISQEDLAQLVVEAKGLDFYFKPETPAVQQMGFLNEIGLKPVDGEWRPGEEIRTPRELAPFLVSCLRAEEEVKGLIDRGELAGKNAYVTYLEQRGIMIPSGDALTKDTISKILQSPDFKDPLMSQPALVLPPKVEPSVNEEEAPVDTRVEMEAVEAKQEALKAVVGDDDDDIAGDDVGDDSGDDSGDITDDDADDDNGDVTDDDSDDIADDDIVDDDDDDICKQDPEACKPVSPS